MSDWAGEQTDETAVRDLTAEVTQLRAERDQLKRRTRDLLADVDELSAQLQEYGRGRALSVRPPPPSGSARSAVPQRLMDCIFCIAHGHSVPARVATTTCRSPSLHGMPGTNTRTRHTGLSNH